MATTTTKINKPLIPRAKDYSPSPIGYNRAALYSGKALDFDGVNDYVDCGTLDVTAYTAISVSLNLKLANTTDILRFVSLQHTGIDDLRIVQNGDTIFFTLDDGTAYSVETPTLTANEWNKLDMTFDGTTLKGYVNGILIGSITASFDFSTASGLLTLFKHSGAVQYAEGSMSGFKIFNTALTAAQVADLYLNPEKIVPDGVADSALKLWLPMMEGAGTTAYDGSGNGNHGTISGATWVSGIGAPVAQTALVSWNKGTNVVQNTDVSASYWSAGSQVTRTGDQESVSGLYNSATLIKDTTTNAAHWAGAVVSTSASTTYIQAAFVKKKDSGIYASLRTNGVGGDSFIVFDFDSATIVGVGSDIIDSGVIAFSNGWYRIWMKYTLAPSGIIIGVSNSASTPIPSYAGTGIGFYADFPTLEAADEIGPALTTNGTAQTSPVLLPQGLTANKDITGVNAFESARNPYALNLDGASWGEVHDNASLDFGTGSFSLEVWAKLKYVAQGSSYNVIMSMGLNISNPYSVGMLVNQLLEPIFIYNNTGTAESARTEGEWVHIVGTYDETRATIYVNGVQKDQDVRTAVDTTNPLVKHIGRDTTSVRFYNDQLALPRIYNRALTATEVARNYNADRSKFGL